MLICLFDFFFQGKRYFPFYYLHIMLGVESDPGPFFCCFAFLLHKFKSRVGNSLRNIRLLKRIPEITYLEFPGDLLTTMSPVSDKILCIDWFKSRGEHARAPQWKQTVACVTFLCTFLEYPGGLGKEFLSSHFGLKFSIDFNILV